MLIRHYSSIGPILAALFFTPRRCTSFILKRSNHFQASALFSMNTEEREETPTWCPEQQIYIGGVVPDSAEVQTLIDENQGRLCLFGYGSLCWGPGNGILSRPGVTTTPGRARGYKRCWSQKSADHRGTTSFPGIVCTLLRDEEVEQITHRHVENVPTMTEGLLYTVPSELVKECLAELDFREKGGYARDVIEVVQDVSGETVKALLYRGTPDNPAFWKRASLDLPFAAAIMSVSIGPSGRNDQYLHSLFLFMEQQAASSTAAAKAMHDHTGDTDTGYLSSMVKAFQESNDLYFLFGSGSNQHNQLLLKSTNDDLLLRNGEDALELSEIVLCTDRQEERHIPRALLAGGGHSGLLTGNGKLYLWGWNQHGQLGTSGPSNDNTAPLLCIRPLQDISVKKAALGFSHTLVIEKETGRLYAFGDNGRGQVDGSLSSGETVDKPVTPTFVKDESFIDVAAGLFHSAAVTVNGEVVTFGCGRFGQSISDEGNSDDVCTGRWRPEDGSRLVRVACGRRHTAVLDDCGRVWTFGENKYGQLGRDIGDGKFDRVPRLVAGSLDEKESGGFDIDSGWSHTVVRTSKGVYGWGRNDRGQLGTGSRENLSVPTPLFENVNVQSIACGSESTMVLDNAGTILGCGWNEHGNLGLGNDSDSLVLQPVTGARIVAPPFEGRGDDDDLGKEDIILMAKGGAHLLAMKI